MSVSPQPGVAARQARGLRGSPARLPGARLLWDRWEVLRKGRGERRDAEPRLSRRRKPTPGGGFAYKSSLIIAQCAHVCTHIIWVIEMHWRRKTVWAERAAGRARWTEARGRTERRSRSPRRRRRGPRGRGRSRRRRLGTHRGRGAVSRPDTHRETKGADRLTSFAADELGLGHEHLRHRERGRPELGPHPVALGPGGKPPSETRTERTPPRIPAAHARTRSTSRSLAGRRTRPRGSAGKVSRTPSRSSSCICSTAHGSAGLTMGNRRSPTATCGCPSGESRHGWRSHHHTENRCWVDPGTSAVRRERSAPPSSSVLSAHAR